MRGDEGRARRGTRRAAPGRVVDRPEEARRGRFVASSSFEEAADTAAKEAMDTAAMDEAWEQSGSLRAMRKVLRQKDANVLAEIDKTMGEE